MAKKRAEVKVGKASVPASVPEVRSVKDRLRKVDVPEGCSGSWEVKRFTVSEDEAKRDEFSERLAAIQGRPYRPVSAGSYTRLARRGYTIMTDTPSELRDLREPVRRAVGGHVLINGLGLGIVLQAVLEEPAVEHLTVVEASEDVIALVAPHWGARYGDRLAVVHADAFGWRPPRGARYDVVWHDIWDDITTDSLAGMRRLHAKYRRRCGWQGSWCRMECGGLRRVGW